MLNSIKHGRLRATIQEGFGPACISDQFFLPAFVVFSMSRSYAILIDAGFLKRKLGSQLDPLTVSKVEAFIQQVTGHPALHGLVLHRIYYYDAPPLTSRVNKPLNGGLIDFALTPLARATQSLNAALVRLPFFALRQGDLSFRGWRVKKSALPERQPEVTIKADDLLPDIQQKGVDMRIGLDIASLTLKQQVQVIVLVTGDSDFVPAMKFARREGAQLFLVTMGHNTKEDLLDHADLLLDLPSP